MLSALYPILLQASSPAQQGGKISGVVWILLFVLLALVVWWLLTRAAKAEPPHIETHHDEPAEHAPETHEPDVDLAVEPEARASEPILAAEELAAPEIAAPVEPDDLTKLEGIGPKVNGVLQNAGIFTFAQLAAADTAHLKEILEAAGYNYMDPTTWPEQASLAAQGNWEEFEKLTASLKGGRKA